MNFSVIEILDSEIISKLENLRFNAYGMDCNEDIDVCETIYARDMQNGRYVVYGAFYNNELIGSCYVSKAYDSLFVEQLFVARKFQRSELHVGGNLLEYVLGQRNYIENYFDCNFMYSCLDSVDGAQKLYKRIGYVPTGNFLMKRRLK